MLATMAAYRFSFSFVQLDTRRTLLAQRSKGKSTLAGIHAWKHLFTVRDIVDAFRMGQVLIPAVGKALSFGSENGQWRSRFWAGGAEVFAEGAGDRCRDLRLC